MALDRAISVEVRVLRGADVYEGRTVLRRVEAEPLGADSRPFTAGVLQLMLEQPRMSVRSLARRAGWYCKTGVPNTAKTHRVLKLLEKEGLACIYRGRWIVTAQGRKLGRSSAHETSETACAR